MIATENMFKPAYNISLMPSVVVLACISLLRYAALCRRLNFYRVTGTHLQREKNILLHALHRKSLRVYCEIHEISRSVAKTNKEDSHLAEILDTNLHTMQENENSHEYSPSSRQRICDSNNRKTINFMSILKRSFRRSKQKRRHIRQIRSGSIHNSEETCAV